MNRLVLTLWALVALHSPASAQDCQGALRLVVGRAPGGGTDALARIVAQKYAEKFRRPVIVENKVGAGGNIAASFVAKAPPDGCTLLVTANWHHGNLFLYGQPGYGAQEFAPVMQAAESTSVLVVNAQQPFTTLAELVDHARANPGKLSYGSSGIGSSNMLMMELLLKAAGVQIVHIPYRGAGPAVVDTLAGTISATVSGATAVQAHIASGKLRALAVMGPTRWPSLPAVPTIADAGYRDAASVVWMGILAPAVTPRAVREKLNGEFRTVVAEQSVGDALRADGYLPLGGTVAQFDQFLKDDLRVTQKLMTSLKLKVE